MSWRTAGEHLLLKGPVPDTNGLTVALVAMGIVGSTVGSANAGIVADIAGDWVNATAEPAGWVYLESNAATGGTEVSLTPNVDIGDGATGFGGVGSGGMSGILGDNANGSA